MLPIRLTKISFIILLVLAMPIFLGAYTLEPTDETGKLVDQYFFESLDKAKNVDYMGALKDAKKIIDLVPEHPAGYLFSAAILSWIMSDYYNYDYADDFFDYIDKTIDLSDNMIQKKRLDPWGYIYLGGAYGFRGTYYSEIGSFYYAFVDGVRGNYELRKSLELGPNIYDNYFGTGTFDFWRAYYAGRFFWLGGGDSKKDKQEGIDKIKLAIDKGKYTTLEASFSLVRIYLVDERYQDAIDVSKKLLKVSPNSIKVRKFMAVAYQKNGDFEEAIVTLRELENFIEQSSLKTPAILLEIKINLAKVYLDMGKKTEATVAFNEAHTYKERTEPKNDFLEDLIGEYDDLSEKINKS